MANAEPAPSAQHWENVYAARDLEEVSWFQSHAEVSTRLIDQLGIGRDDAVLDVGGGASTFVDDLLVRGFNDVTVLDISAAALAAARTRLSAVRGVEWIVADLLTWRPKRTYRLWHDRAVLHFLTSEAQRRRYMDTVRSATAVGSSVVIGVFAEDGPSSCSGLPVRRYASEDLRDLLGEEFIAVSSVREEHATPNGVIQPFTWLAARRCAG